MENGLIKKVVEGVTDEDMINMFPLALIAIGTLGTMLALKRCGDRMQTTSNKMLQWFVLHTIVEITTDDDLSCRR